MKLITLRYQDPATKTYLGCPSLVRLPNGDLLAAHSYFGPGCPRNHEGEEHLTSVYRSTDNGESWVNVTHIANAFWSTLFCLGTDVYLLGTSQQWGSIVIRRSSDGGNTWTHPADEKSGLLFRGGAAVTPPNYHGAPVPVLIKAGRIYRAFQDCTPLAWPSGFQACVISAETGADLLDAAAWRMSNKLPLDRGWLAEGWDAACGWEEGNVLEGPDGQIWNILRLNGKKTGSPVDWFDAWMDKRYSVYNTAAMVKVEDEGRVISFDPQTGYINLPGGHSKFTIRRDPQTGQYLVLSNAVLDIERPTLRSSLSLSCSPDLRHWRHCQVILVDDSGLPYEESIRKVGFQYVDWQFDGEDIIALVRTAYDGADNFHNSNRITFHRFRNFRGMLAES